MVYLWDLLDDIFNLRHGFVGSGQAASRRHADVYHHGSLVFLRNQGCLCGFHEVDQQHARHYQRAPREPTLVDEEHDSLFIFSHHGIERGIISSFHDAIDAHFPFFAASGTHPHGAKCRTQGQGVQTGNTYGYSHGHTELSVKDT